MIGRAASTTPLVLLLVLACSEASDDDGAVDAGQDAATGCDSYHAHPGGPCGEPGRVCELGSLSCWKRATCQPSGDWEITCGIFFPDGGPCC